MNTCLRAFFTVLTAAAIAVAPICAHADTIRADENLKIDVSQPGDFEMTCEQLWNEAFLMRTIIAQTKEDQDDSKMQSRGIGVAGTAASFLVGTVTGGIGLAAAGFLANRATSNNSEDAELIQEAAQQRRAMIAGIFGAKGCNGPIEDAFTEPRRLPDDAKNVASVEPASGAENLKAGYND